jgi:uncharacterized protein
LIAVDANLLIYAASRSFPQHRAAKEWLDAQLSGIARVGLPWASILAFLRVLTNPRILEHPVPIAEAWAAATAWLSADPVWVPQPTGRHAEVFGGLLAVPGVRGNLIHDADLAALAIEHGLILCSTDRDFARFPNLRWTNPLSG